MGETSATVAGRAINMVVDPTRARQNLMWFGFTVIALLGAPDSPGTGTVIWLLIASVLGALSLTNIFQARKLEEPGRSLIHLAITFGTGLAATIISMVIEPISGFFLLAVLFLLAYTSEHRPFVTAALTAILVPMWIWMAADSWEWELLMLVPIVGLGLIAVSHLLDTHVWPEDEERILPERAHRSAAWLLMAITGILIILVGMFTGVNRAWLALAGIVLAAAIPLEAGVGIDGKGSAKPGMRVLTAAYFIALCCWLIGIE